MSLLSLEFLPKMSEVFGMKEGISCPRCGQSCEEQRVRQRRDGSVLIRAIPCGHNYSEWPTSRGQ